MSTIVHVVDPAHPQAAVIAAAAEVLRRGGLVAFPTETVYGLGADALSDAAVRRIFAAKGRPANNPVIVHVGDVAAARQLTRPLGPPRRRNSPSCGGPVR
jgi:L-threonylcarbamoyladenylate synthase